ncbi:hypothetical protein EVG20_g10679 [Dentipellis fragilis]|uniref:Uncharacterized protein n=1 Tax=Dentipellis fragilis TaxID=205917 RepID=A0A4Y9XPX8_9AGAM|nr:hypothetical protein EVG20_g10679 [Dentipellis fragilis]
MASNQGEGRRQDILTKQRNQMREDFERQKQQLINETEKSRPSSNRFVGQNDSMEESLKKSTVGLVRLEDFQQRRKELEEAKAREAAQTDELKEEQKKVEKRKKAAKSTLSFLFDLEREEAELYCDKSPNIDATARFAEISAGIGTCYRTWMDMRAIGPDDIAALLGTATRRAAHQLCQLNSTRSVQHCLRPTHPPLRHVSLTSPHVPRGHPERPYASKLLHFYATASPSSSSTAMEWCHVVSHARARGEAQVRARGHRIFFAPTQYLGKDKPAHITAYPILLTRYINLAAFNVTSLLRTLRVLETERSEVVLRLHLRAKGLAYEALATAEGE